MAKPTKAESAGGGGAKPREPPRLLKTSEVIERSGVTRQMLYMYTTMGLVHAEKKTPGGQKLYPERVLVQLKLIRTLQETRNYTLRELKDLFFK